MPIVVPRALRWRPASEVPVSEAAQAATATGARELFEVAFAHAPIGIALISPQGRLLEVNRRLCEIVGRSEAELLTLTLQELTHPADRVDALRLIERLLAGEPPASQTEARYLAQDGGTIWAEMTLSLLCEERGRPQLLIAQISDISARRAAEAALQRERQALHQAQLAAVHQREHAEVILDAVSEGYMLVRDDTIVEVNDALCQLTAFARQELIGSRAPFPFWAAENQQRIGQIHRRTMRRGGGSFEVTFARRDGSRFEAEVRSRAALRADGSLIGYVNTVRDVSRRKRHDAELERLATRDPLTGLVNQRVFRERLREEVVRAERRQEPLSLVILDLDAFKAVNDRYGHPAGDAVLQEASARLSRVVRHGELLARVGGEEFAWILPGAGSLGAYAAAERARHTLSAVPFPQAGRITLSAGVCELSDARDGEHLYRLADQALYRAKQQGRDRTVRHAPRMELELVG